MSAGAGSQGEEEQAAQLDILHSCHSGYRSSVAVLLRIVTAQQGIGNPERLHGSVHIMHPDDGCAVHRGHDGCSHRAAKSLLWQPFRQLADEPFTRCTYEHRSAQAANLSAASEQFDIVFKGLSET